MRHRDLLLGISALLLTAALTAWCLAPGDDAAAAIAGTAAAAATAPTAVPSTSAPPRAQSEPVVLTPQASLAPPLRPAEGASALPAPSGPSGPPAPPTTPEEKLAQELGLTPEETERVAEVIRAADAQLRADMAALAERGYDDVAARHLGARFEEELLASVEAALPEARRPAFRALMEQERQELEPR